GSTMTSFFFSSRRRHTRFSRDWSSDVCSSDLAAPVGQRGAVADRGAELLERVAQRRAEQHGVERADQRALLVEHGRAARPLDDPVVQGAGVGAELGGRHRAKALHRTDASPPRSYGLSQAVVSGGSAPSSSRPLASSTGRSGSGTGRGPRLVTQVTPESRVKASTSSPYESQRSVPSPRCSRRSRSPVRYRLSIESRSASWDSAVSLRQLSGCGSHGDGPPKPNGGSSPDQGSGTRQPSRPGFVPPDLAYMGSWRTSSGRSSTSGSPSSSP